MENILKFEDSHGQNVNETGEVDLIQARYNFLLSEQPQLENIEPTRFKTLVLGGCVATLVPIYIDFQSTFKDAETLICLLIVAFLMGAILAGIFSQYMNKKAFVENMKILQNWQRPIIVLPKSPTDNLTDARAKFILDTLKDEKCLNTLDTALKDAQISFDYSIEYGFRTGEKCQTNEGLPVVSLIPQLFVLRGAFDKKIWFEFQKEAVRITLEIDNDFAKCWFSIENEKYRTIAGGQLTA